MKNSIVSLFRLAIVSLAAIPALASAAVPATGSAYYTDETNSYVQDQTSQVMGNLNGILCFMGAMAPDLMVNGGNYIALVDKNTCDAKGSGGQNGNTGPAYVPALVNSTRASTADPMLVRAWLEFSEPGNIQKISVKASASQAPTLTNPYGVFRMDFCGDTATANCPADKGYIDASTGGLAFYSTSNRATDSETTSLLLNATSSTDGSGVISQAYNWNGSSGNFNFSFAYNAAYFARSDGSVTQCFNRSPASAHESVWRYGLYDVNGAQVTRNSGFPIEYTDSVSGVTGNGYIGYYGMWTQGAGPLSGTMVNKVTYSNTGATKTAYTLLKTGGKLMKYTTANKTLADLNKVTFWYYAQNSAGVMAAGSQYELYWDNTAGTFVVSGKQGSTGNMEPLAPTAVANGAMVTANPWGLWGWSQMMGGQFGIKGSEFAKLNSIPATMSGLNVNVATQTQDVVYPSQFAALGNLTCINDCPTAALIGTSNLVVPPAAQSSPFANPGWSTVPSASLIAYTPNGQTGNLTDPATSPVVSTATTGWNANGIRSGRMVDAAGLAAINTAKSCGGTCASYNQGDVDLLPAGSSYYVWETGGQPWNQMAILMSGITPVTFDPPLQVSFAVPNTTKYGTYAGANISLQYGGFGDLWGIPNECIDMKTNAACNFAAVGGTAQNDQRWTSKFSIPFDTATGVVTANAGATTYYVKALDKEIRLANVPCNTAGVPALPAAGITPPDGTNWQDPTSIGAKPVLSPVPAPQVIHGVKQY